MRDFEDFGEVVSKGGKFREYVEHRIISDKEDILLLRDTISKKPDRLGEGPTVYHDVEQGEVYAADYSSSENRVVELFVSEDKETAVLALTDV